MNHIPSMKAIGLAALFLLSTLFGICEIACGETYGVRYRVSGTGRRADIRYNTPQGYIVLRNERVPYESPTYRLNSGDFAYISAQHAQDKKYNSVVVEIIINGTPVTRYEGQGSYAIAETSCLVGGGSAGASQGTAQSQLAQIQAEALRQQYLQDQENQRLWQEEYNKEKLKKQEEERKQLEEQKRKELQKQQNEEQKWQEDRRRRDAEEEERKRDEPRKQEEAKKQFQETVQRAIKEQYTVTIKLKTGREMQGKILSANGHIYIESPTGSMGVVMWQAIESINKNADQ